MYLEYYEEECLEEETLRTRALRRKNRQKAIAHNRKIYNAVVGGHIWFDSAMDGRYHSYHSAQVKTNRQDGRWETNCLKTRSFMDTGRVHYGDRHRKGKRAYKWQHLDKVCFRQALMDYADEAEEHIA